MLSVGFRIGIFMRLIHCIYASSATQHFREADIPELLSRARTKNQILGITGMLLFIEGSFFQVLEGEAVAVDEIYAAIGNDSRHDRVTQIIREPIRQRSFEDWSMGFACVARQEIADAIGANDFFSRGSCLEHIEPGRARKLLAAFGAGRWRHDRTGAYPARARVA